MNIDIIPSVEEWREANQIEKIQLHIENKITFLATLFQHDGQHVDDTGWNRFKRTRYYH